MATWLRFEGLSFSTTHHSVARGGVPVIIGGRGLDILACLLGHPRQLVTAEQLAYAAWDNRSVHPNNLAVQVSLLRKALGKTADGKPLIRTVPGRGYILCADVERLDDPGPDVQRRFVAPATRFIGRAAELACLEAALARSRSITVVGPGGVGKTRLVQQLLGSKRPGTWAGVDLAQVMDAAQIVAAMAAVLGDVDPTLNAVVARLRDASLLLALDNTEHVAAGLGAMLPALLRDCPGVSTLVTSRHLLRSAGETVFRLAPMALPPLSITSAAELTRYDCVQLFVDRAASAEPGFTLHDANAPAVASICRKLDGIALAVEMIVPRLRAMSAGEIAVSLHERFEILQPSGSDVLPRQRSLRTMLDWSWDLLAETERDALMRLAVFRAATTGRILGAMEPARQPQGLVMSDALLGLADKSLITVDKSGAETRYGLLQTTRDYVLARIPVPDLRQRRNKHASVTAELMECARDRWPGAPTTSWLQQYQDMADDLREALAWTTGGLGCGATAVRLVAASLPLWLELPGSPLGEMHGWFDRAAPQLDDGTPSSQQAWFRIGQSWRATQFGDVDHQPIAKQAVLAARDSGDGTALGVALMRHGHTLMRPETMEAAESLFREAELQLRSDAPGKWLCLTLTRRADAMVRLGQFKPGLHVYDEAIDLAHALEFKLGRIVSISNSAEVLFALGRQTEALDRLAALVARTPPGTRSPAMATLAAHLALAGRTAEAAVAAAEVAKWALVTGMHGPLAWVAEVVAMLLIHAGRLAAAASLAGYAVQVLPAIGTRFGSRRIVYLDVTGQLATRLSVVEHASLYTAGAAWNARQASDAVSVACLSFANQAQPPVVQRSTAG